MNTQPDIRNGDLHSAGPLGYNESAALARDLERVCALSADAAARLRELSGHRAYRLARLLCRVRHGLPDLRESDPLYPVICSLESCAAFSADTRRAREQAIRRLLESWRSETVFVFLETVDWDIPLFQRPQQMALALGRMGLPVFYGTPNGRDRVSDPALQGPNCVLLPWDGAETALRLAKDCGKKTVLGLCSTDMIHTLADLDRLRRYADQLLYEYIDALSEDISGPIGAEIRRRHEVLLSDPAVFIVATADALYRHAVTLRGSAQRCLCSGNGVDTAHFAAVRDPSGLTPELAAVLDVPRPVIGYFGALASWFDYELVARAAKERPGYDFVLLGERYDSPGSRGLASLAGRKNVRWAGPVPYEQLPHAAAFFTAAMIPFVRNEVTLATSPIKLFEYMALGKPVVSTDLPECRKEPLALIARDGAEFVRALDTALARSRDPSFVKKLREAAAENSWGAKARQIARFLGIQDRAAGTKGETDAFPV